MAIVPDTKDWTWVLRSRCPECGFDAGTVAKEQLPRIIRDCSDTFRTELTTRPDVRERPSPSTWSPLEYGCHVRDVFRRFDDRVVSMLTQDDPQFANWDQDATAVDDRYGEQDPQVVADELGDAAELMASRLERVRDDEWDRTGRRSDGTTFTVLSLGRYMVHDSVHHVHDIQKNRAAVTP